MAPTAPPPTAAPAPKTTPTRASRRRARRTAVVCLAALVATVAACGEERSDEAAAPATSSSTSTAPQLVVEELSEGRQGTSLAVDVKGPVQVNYRKITFPPGAGTGKHCHDGNLVGVVERGTLTHYAPVYDDGVHEYEAGDSLVEGPGYVHEGRNEGTEDVVLWVTYLTPEGDPLSQSDLAECDTR